MKKTYLAHFVYKNGSIGGGQEVKAVSLTDAKHKGEVLAKMLGKILADITGPMEEE